MSNRQARIARKKAQKEGTEVFVHVKPQKRVLAPARVSARYDDEVFQMAMEVARDSSILSRLN